MKAKKVADNYRVDSGRHFRLKDFDPAEIPNIRQQTTHCFGLGRQLGRHLLER
jgi:hypothetical protein